MDTEQSEQSEKYKRTGREVAIVKSMRELSERFSLSHKYDPANANQPMWLKGYDTFLSQMRIEAHP